MLCLEYEEPRNQLSAKFFFFFFPFFEKELSVKFETSSSFLLSDHCCDDICYLRVL